LAPVVARRNFPWTNAVGELLDVEAGGSIAVITNT
jgi:hypothetical protein